MAFQDLLADLRNSRVTADLACTRVELVRSREREDFVTSRTGTDLWALFGEDSPEAAVHRRTPWFMKTEAPPAGIDYLTVINTLCVGPTYEVALAGTSTVISGALIEGTAYNIVSFHAHAAPIPAPSVLVGDVGASTIQRLAPMSSLKAQAMSLLALAEREEFEFGEDSVLSQSFASLVTEHGVRAVHALHDALSARPPSTNVMGQLLREVGRMLHKTSHHIRKSILLEHLKSRSVRVRHAAATGLAELDDPTTIPALEMLHGREDSGRLKRHIARVLEQLRETARCRGC